MDEITINVVISDRNYTITINRNEEEKIRKAAKEINEKVKKFSQLYAYKDKQDLLAMTALQLSTEKIDREYETENQNKSTENKITELIAVLDDCLNK